MNRFLHWFNLAGVFALVGLSVLQWQANRQLNLQLHRIERSRLDLTSRLQEQAATGANQAGDLADLRNHLARVSDELRRTADELAETQRRMRQSDADRDLLKSSVTNWAGAVAVRDERIAQAATQLKALTAERDNAIRKFNDLVERYNALVKEFDRSRRTGPAATTNSPPPQGKH